MSPFSEQFSQARKLQLETQLNFFRDLTGKAFESAEKLVALNLDTSRISLDQSSNLVRQLISVKDPRDLFVLTGQTQSQFNSMLSYSRQLFGIATANLPGADVTAAPAAVLAAPAPQALAEKMPAAEVVAAADVEPTLVAEANNVVEATPIAQPKPVTKAVGNAEALMPSAASFPVPSSAQPIAVAPVKPVDAKPPAATPSIATAKAQAPGAKAARKK